ncbi:unnamed protein product [Lactuca virosa]|uniref:Uncharacterized protein n=1 Tax=Lactuca virosa TaxID=75947 RepID=A0AAU9M714_9ASTR|nr:unnamed protein product [Lactuca virosa]
MENIVVFSPDIPKNYTNKGFEDFMAYLSSFPLHYALVDVPDSFLPQHVIELYFTSTFTDAGVIVGTVNDGIHTILVTVMDVRRSLRLPIRDEYFPLLSIDECHAVLENMDYDFGKQKDYIIHRHYLPSTWKFLNGVLGKCFTHKMIFDQFAEIIQGSKRSPHVPYSRWLTLILQHIGTSCDDDQAEDWTHSLTSSKLFNQDLDDEWSITKWNETHSLSNQQTAEDTQVDTGNLSHYDKDANAVNENLDAGNNYKSQDTKMVHVFPDQAKQANLQDLNESESIRPNKHIQFEYSSSADEEDIVLENPPTQLSDQQGNDADTEYILETSPCDQGFIYFARTSSPASDRTPYFSLQRGLQFNMSLLPLFNPNNIRSFNKFLLLFKGIKQPFKGEILPTNQAHSHYTDIKTDDDGNQSPPGDDHQPPPDSKSVPPPQSDDAKKGKNDANIGTSNVEEDIPESDGEDEVYCMELSFMDVNVQPLQEIFLDTDTSGADDEGEQHIPQGEPSDVESNDDLPLNKKRKAKADFTSDAGPSKKKHK